TWLVLAASMMAFAGGGLLIALPRLRRRETLFGAVVLVVAAALLYPEPLLLVVQSATLGLVAIVVVLVLRKSVAVYRPLMPGRSSGSTLSSGSAFRGSSAPTRLSPSGAAPALAGSSRAAIVSSPPGAAQATT